MKLNYKFAELIGLSLQEIQSKKLDFFQNKEVKYLDPDYYLSNFQEGIEFIFEADKKLSNIQMHGGDKEGFSRYEGELPVNLDFSDSKDSSHRKIGIKDYKSGGGEIVPVLGRINEWRKYYFDNCSLHLEFTNEDTISLITIGSIL